MRQTEGKKRLKQKTREKFSTHRPTGYKIKRGSSLTPAQSCQLKHNENTGRPEVPGGANFKQDINNLLGVPGPAGLTWFAAPF